MNILVYGYFLAAYLLGSISSAVIICRLAGLPDPRETGSKNPGTTNVFRIGGKLATVGVLLTDIAKGALPILIGYHLELTPLALGLTGFFACLGHIFPIFFGFRGGKGVATAFGVILTLNYLIPSLTFITWLTVFVLSGYASLSAVIAALLLPIYVWFIQPALTFPIALICCLLVYRHHDNIQRLWRGQEDKIWHRKKK